MKELTIFERGLVPVYENGNEERLVNAREMHEFLEVGKDYTTWIKSRIEKYGFIEDADFVTIPQKRGVANGGYKMINEYYLTIDTAKEIAMVENNEQGRIARKYFIEVEKKAKQLFSLPTTMSEALQLAANEAKRREEFEAQVLLMTPKVEFYDAVADTTTTHSMDDVAKLIGKRGLGQRNLFKLLRDRNILHTNNLPMQKHINMGHFEVVLINARIGVVPTTRVTQKGLEFIIKLVEDKEF